MTDSHRHNTLSNIPAHLLAQYISPSNIHALRSSDRSLRHAYRGLHKPHDDEVRRTIRMGMNLIIGNPLRSLTIEYGSGLADTVRIYGSDKVPTGLVLDRYSRESQFKRSDKTNVSTIYVQFIDDLNLEQFRLQTLYPVLAPGLTVPIDNIGRFVVRTALNGPITSLRPFNWHDQTIVYYNGMPELLELLPDRPGSRNEPLPNMPGSRNRVVADVEAPLPPPPIHNGVYVAIDGKMYNVSSRGVLTAGELHDLNMDRPGTFDAFKNLQGWVVSQQATGYRPTLREMQNYMRKGKRPRRR